MYYFDCDTDKYLILAKVRERLAVIYKVVQIWLGHMRLVYTQISPGHIWTTLYISDEEDFNENVDFVDLHSYSFVQEVKLVQ